MIESIKKNLEKLLEDIGLPEIIKIKIIKGKKGEILNYIPFSNYYNDSLGIDKHHEERVYILNRNGKKLYTVESGYDARKSDGSTSHNEGQSVKKALEKLGKKINTAKYILVIKHDETQDNTGVLKAIRENDSSWKSINKIKYKELKLYTLG